MDIDSIKTYMKQNKISQIDLSQRSKIPLQTIRKILSGNTQNPRIDTVQAIEKALGIYNAPELSEDVQSFLQILNGLTQEELAELEQFVDFIISKRK